MPNDIEQQENLKAWAQILVNNFTEGKSLSEVVAFMVKSGWKEESASTFASSIAQRLTSNHSLAEFQRSHKARSYRNRMIRGLIWSIAGIAITVITYLFTEPGGQFIICGGVIFFGVIDFLIGFFGWIGNL
jgi:hypothetical protein